MCAGLIDLLLLSDLTPHLFDSLAAALRAVYDPSEVTSDAARVQCAQVSE
jgi:hypothetical protein